MTHEICKLYRIVLERSNFRSKKVVWILKEQFLEVSVKVLLKLKIPHIIGKAVWEQRGDIRDVSSIGKLVRKSDGPEEVEQILSTMMSKKNEIYKKY